MSIRVGILDQTPIYEGETAVDAFRHTIELAQRAEQLGFHRFWVSEHHDSGHVAGSSPEVLISHLLAHTKRIRLGSVPSRLGLHLVYCLQFIAMA